MWSPKWRILRGVYGCVDVADLLTSREMQKTVQYRFWPYRFWGRMRLNIVRDMQVMEVIGGQAISGEERVRLAWPIHSRMAGGRAS